jgi:cysteine desulfurase
MQAYMVLSARLYLDHAATTPVLPAASQTMMEALSIWANPSSPHLDGRTSRKMVENARAELKTALDWDGEVIFTGGASEAIAMAFNSPKFVRKIVSPTEHDAVLRCAGDAGQRLAVDLQGRVVLTSVQRLLVEREGHALVAVQSVNNETGVIQPVDDIGEIVAKEGGTLFCDCAQSAGKIQLPDADLISISAHKFGGPPGVGALLVKDLGLLLPSGGQEKGYRAGTENVPAILAMVAALKQKSVWLDRAVELRRQLDIAIEKAGGNVIAKDAVRLPNIGGYHMPGVSANAQLIQFDLAGISVSAGSACSSGSLKSSHVLGAMGWDDSHASEVIRVSFGPQTSRADVYRFIEEWTKIFTKVRESDSRD